MVYIFAHLVKKFTLKKIFMTLIENFCHCCGYNIVRNTFFQKSTLSTKESKKWRKNHSTVNSWPLYKHCQKTVLESWKKSSGAILMRRAQKWNKIFAFVGWNFEKNRFCDKFSRFLKKKLKFANGFQQSLWSVNTFCN